MAAYWPVYGYIISCSPYVVGAWWHMGPNRKVAHWAIPTYISHMTNPLQDCKLLQIRSIFNNKKKVQI